MATKCTFCKDGIATQKTVDGLPICADCANAAPSLMRELDSYSVVVLDMLDEGDNEAK